MPFKEIDWHSHKEKIYQFFPTVKRDKNGKTGNKPKENSDTEGYRGKRKTSRGNMPLKTQKWRSGLVY